MRRIKLLYPYPALLLAHGGKQNLIISDIHIGFEEKFIAAGINILTSVKAMTNTLITILQEHKPDRLIVLGDVKHSIYRIRYHERQNVLRFLEELSSKVETIIVRGNHDGCLKYLLPKSVNLLDKTGLIVGDTGLIHGHTKLPNEFLSTTRLIMGHIHPRYSRKGSPLNGQQVWLLLKVRKTLFFKDCKNEYLEIYILPSFNQELALAKFTIKNRISSPIIRMVRKNVKEALIMTLEGNIIGDRASIKYIL